MIPLGKLRRDVARRLARRRGYRKAANLISHCEGDSCGKCGDACPVRGARVYGELSDRLARLLTQPAGIQIRELTLSRMTWCRAKSQLSGANLDSVSKTLRRAFDSLREPTLVACGVVDAWWGSGQWEIGARVLAAAPAAINLYRAFDHTRNIKGPLELLEISDVQKATFRLFRDAQVTKHWIASSNINSLNRSVRGEYYAWLAGLGAGRRIFRYGCDRYFNRLEKEPLPVRHKPKKPHPYPFWLEPYQYGTHDQNCKCRMCRVS